LGGHRHADLAGAFARGLASGQQFAAVIEVPLDGEQVVLVEVDDEDFYQGGDALAPVANVDEMLASDGFDRGLHLRHHLAAVVDRGRTFNSDATHLI
jgi:hypothetical protein